MSIGTMTRRMVLAAVATAMLIAAPLAQTTVARDREALLRRMDYLIRDGGEWSAPNRDYKPGAREARTFGYRWKWLFDQQVAHLEIFGVFDGDVRATFWTTTVLWDATSAEGKMHQVGSNGTFADGTLSWTREGENEVRLTFVTADGEMWAFRETDTILGPDEFRTTSARLRGGQWADERNTIWKRVRKSKDQR
jgi:hypothetical protein